jgi:hypothetical protein
MPGLTELALGAAPIAGGALFGIAAGAAKPPDIRAAIIKDLDLLDRLPPEQAERRERLRESIDHRIDDLLAANERSRKLRQAASSYEGNWRDIVVFLCAILFTFVWWNISHQRAHWLITFVVLIVVSALAGYYAARGIIRAFKHVNRDRRSS